MFVFAYLALVASSLFRPRRFVLRERRGFFVNREMMWKLEDTVAVFESTQLSCRLDVADPKNGLRDLRGMSLAESDAALWQVALPVGRPELAEFYVRGNDLVATYKETETRPCRTQFYWRFVTEQDCFGFEFIISVQTSRLDYAPKFSIATVWPSPISAMSWFNIFSSTSVAAMFSVLLSTTEVAFGPAAIP